MLDLLGLQIAFMDIERGETTWLSTSASDKLIRDLAHEAGEVAAANDLIRSLEEDSKDHAK